MKKQYIFLVFLCLLIVLFLYRRAATGIKDSTVTINSAQFNVEIANTPERRTKGLGYRDSLPDNQGMVFIFDNPGHYSFWMHGMRFPLDIIFILNGKVVGVYENLPPAPDTDPNPPTWGNELLSDRVLEINAGLVSKYNIKVGDVVNFKLK